MPKLGAARPAPRTWRNDNETLKALLMIAMFGILRTALCIRNIRTVGHALQQALTEAWHAIALPNYTMQPVPVRRRRRKN